MNSHSPRRGLLAALLLACLAVGSPWRAGAALQRRPPRARAAATRLRCAATEPDGVAADAAGAVGAAGAGAAGTEAAQEGTTAGGTTTLEKGVFGGGSGGELLEDSDFSVNTILKQLESIQQGSPKNIVILGTRHCSFLHQQIIELLSFALVLSDNHIFTSGATGTHAAAIRGALRAGNQELLTVILPQTIQRQPQEIRDLLGQARAPPPPSPPNTHSARRTRHRTAARALSRAATTARRSTA